MSTILLANLIDQGVEIAPHEAVAIAQLLIENGAVAPSPENVQLRAEGDAWCVGCDVTPAVFEIAGLLQKLIPPRTPQVPGILRYTIARALLEVDAQPFDSLEEFSRSLARFERGDRRAIVRDLISRRPKPVMLHIVPRSAAPPVAALPLRTAPAVVVSMPRLPTRVRRRRRFVAAATLLVGAVGVIGVADVMKGNHVRPAASAAPAVDRPRTNDLAPRSTQPAGSARSPKPARETPHVVRPRARASAPKGPAVSAASAQSPPT